MVRGKISTNVYAVTTLFIFTVLAGWLVYTLVLRAWRKKHPD